jgi:alpha-mannosidase
MDGSWNLQQLLDTRPKAARDEILNLIRTGKMAMPAQYCNLLTGYASLETLYRSLYQSKSFASRYKLPFEYANITDVPTYSGSYPSILASSGVKYWVAASNNDRAPIFFYDHWNEKSPFWWEGPDGKKVLFWYSRHYMQVQTLFALPPKLEAVRESLPVYLQAYSKPSYKPDVALIYGTQVENTDLFPSTATFAGDWNKSYAYPKLTYATFPDFFHYVEGHFGKDLPTYKGDGGGYWEDGVGSDAYYAAEDRGNQNRALSAEVLSTLTHTIDANLNPPAGLFADIWRNIILFSEHTWASYNSVSQPDHDETVKQLRVKDNRAERAALEIDDVMNRSLSQLADQIHVPANTLVVFNSLNWRRDLPVEVDLLEHPRLTDLSTHEDIPLQVLGRKQGFLHVRFLAKDLPAVGYRCYGITYEKQGDPAVQISHEQTIENRFYRIQLDQQSGAVASIYDKQLHRDVVDSGSPYKFGQYLYVTGGDGDTQMINPFPALPPGELHVHPSSAGKIVAVEHLSWGESIRLESSDLNTPKIETEILLFNNEKKIQFRYRVHKDYTAAKEAVYFAFPVAVSTPAFTYASQQAWVNPARDLMKGGSLEWFNIQNWMAVHDSNLAVGIVPLDASLASFGDINRGKWPGEFKPKTGTIFSYAMNNYWHTNYRAGQSGEFVFRYTITSDASLDGASLSRLGIEEMRPAELNYVVGQDKVGNPERPLPPEGTQFLNETGKDVALITWKRAEDGNGTIARLLNISDHATEATLHFPRLIIESAQLCSGVENDTSDLQVEGNTVRLAFQPFEALTVRLVTR